MRPSGVAATTWSDGGARLLQDQRRRLAVGAGDVDGQRRGVVRGGHEHVAVGIGEHGGVVVEGGDRHDRRR